MHWRRNCFADRTTLHIRGNSSIDTSLIRDIYCGPEVLFETCVAMKFVDDDDDDDDDDDGGGLKDTLGILNVMVLEVGSFLIKSY